MKKIRKPGHQRHTLSAAITVAMFTMQSPVWAACSITIDGSTVTTPCDMITGDTLTLTSTGVLNVSGSPTTDYAVLISSGADGVTIVNGGLIQGDFYGIRAEGGETNLSLTNQAGGTITSFFGNTAIYFAGGFDASNDLTNSGTITGRVYSDNEPARGLYITGDLDGTVTNNSGGVIDALGTGSFTVNGVGIEVTGALNGTLSNSGLIQGEGTFAYTANAYGVSIGSDLTGLLENTSTGTISAIATDGLDNNRAYAIYVGGNLTGTGQLNNDGVISATASGSESSPGATAYGIYINGSLDGSLTNSNTGVIEATATASTESAYAYGIYLDGNLTGGLSNAGQINASATVNGIFWATAYGVYLNGAIDGSLTNTSTGVIDVTASAPSESAYGYGIYTTSGISATGSLTNDGVIEVDALAGNDDATAYGIYLSGNIDGTLTNSSTGMITVYASAGSSDAIAYGIYVAGDVSGSLSNAGDITVTAESYSSGTAYGIYVSGMIAADGMLSNSGTITVSAEGFSGGDAYAHGIFVSGQISGTLINANTGVIDVTATAVSSDVYSANGIFVGGDITSTGSLTNNGTINVSVLSSYYPDARGIYVSGSVYGNLLNAGDINIDVTTEGYEETVYGVFIGGDVEGTVTNSGTVTINHHVGSSSSTEATGWRIDGILSGTFDNQGTISVNMDGSREMSAEGVHVSTLTTGGQLLNSGTIEVDVSGSSTTAYAVGIHLYDMNGGALTNTSTGVITATANSNGDDATATGIDIGDLSGGALTNNGVITVTATATESDASATGIWIYSMSGGTVTNNGTITVTATANSDTASVGGIWVSDTLSGGTITNNGSLVVTATATDYYAGAYGLFTRNMTGGSFSNTDALTVTATVTGSGTASSPYYAEAVGIHAGLMTAGTIANSGTITATADASSASAIGIFADAMDGTVSNSGTINSVATGVVAANAYSLYFTDGVGSVTNEASGILNGNLYAGGTIAVSNAGRINLPNTAAAYVGGNYTQTASGVLGIGAVSSSDYATLEVGGTASFAAGTGIFVDVAGVNSLVRGDTLLDVVDAGSLSASTFTVTDNSALLNFYAIIDGNTVDLTTTPGLTVLQAAILGRASPAAYGVAGALDAINDGGNPSDDMNAVLGVLGTMTEAEIAAAVEQLMPTLSGGVGQLTQQISGVLPDAVDERLGGTGLASGDGMFNDGKAWIKPFGTWTDQDDRKGVYGYEADSVGLALGADTDIDNGWRVGAAFAYANGDVDSNAPNFRHRIDMDSYQLGVYGSTALTDSTTLDLKGAVGMSSYDSNRRIDFLVPVRTATADYDSWHVRLSAKLSQHYAVSDATTVSPHIRADYAHVNIDSYTESGAGALNLAVQEDSESSLILGLGADLSHAASDSLTLKANLGVGYDVTADQSSLQASFVNDGPVFNTQGLDPSRMVMRAGAGVVFAGSESMQVTGRYDIEKREDYKDQGVSLNLRYAF